MGFDEGVEEMLWEVGAAGADGLLEELEGGVGRAEGGEDCGGGREGAEIKAVESDAVEEAGDEVGGGAEAEEDGGEERMGEAG